MRRPTGRPAAPAPARVRKRAQQCVAIWTREESMAICLAFRQHLRANFAAGGQQGVTELVRLVATGDDPALGSIIQPELQSKLQRVFSSALDRCSFKGPSDLKPAIAADNVWRVLRKTAHVEAGHFPRPFASTDSSAATVRRRISAGKSPVRVPAGLPRSQPASAARRRASPRDRFPHGRSHGVGRL